MTDDELDRALANLPRKETPPDDLWPAIETRIQPSGARWLWAFGAAAAVCLGWLWLSGPGHAVDSSPVIAATAPAARPVPSAEVVDEPPSQAGGVAAASLSADEVALRDAAAELALAYSAQRRVLDEELLAVFDDNLAVVDEAIDRSRAALSTSPNDQHLQRTLRQAYDHKLELLRTATSVGDSP